MSIRCPQTSALTGLRYAPNPLSLGKSALEHNPRNQGEWNEPEPIGALRNPKSRKSPEALFSACSRNLERVTLALGDRLLALVEKADGFAWNAFWSVLCAAHCAVALQGAIWHGWAFSAVYASIFAGFCVGFARRALR